jgi:hypothetical protein
MARAVTTIISWSSGALSVLIAAVYVSADGGFTPAVGSLTVLYERRAGWHPGQRRLMCRAEGRPLR